MKQFTLPFDCENTSDSAQAIEVLGVPSLSMAQGVVPVAGSSTENSSNTNNAWRQRFSDGNQNNNNKNNNNRVRCARRNTRPSNHVSDYQFGSINQHPVKRPIMADYPLTLEEVFAAYYTCRKSKRNSPEQLTFEMNHAADLIQLYEDIVARRYKPLPSRVFIVTHPKPREVWAAQFRDRVVHHILYNRLAPIYHKRFIHDSYACIPGRGIHNAVTRLDKFCRSRTHNYQRQAYYGKFDLSNFFPNIHLPTLWDILERDAAVGHEDVRYLMWTILFEQGRDFVEFRSPRQLYDLIPSHKSLFHAGLDRGLPIGNLTSQLLANVYLNELDSFVKHKLGVKHYIRYVDDMVILADSIGELRGYFDVMQAFVEQRLHAQFNPTKTHYNSIDKGIDMLGYYVLPGRIYVRRDTYRRVERRVNAMIERGVSAEELSRTLASYNGLFIHAQSRPIDAMLREAA